MKSMFKKIISCIMAMSMVPLFKIPVEAKIIEPEIVKIEKWTTSYFIDDDIETLYPYVQCEADIYNDGTIKLYMWNTHEWDGFTTVSHTITYSETLPLQVNSSYYNQYTYLKNNGKTLNGEKFFGFYFRTDFSSSSTDYEKDSFGNLSTLNINTFPSQYNGEIYYSENYSSILGNLIDYGKILICVKGKNNPYDPLGLCGNQDTVYPMSGLRSYSIFESTSCALCNLESRESRPDKYKIILKPNEDPTGIYNFRLYGHDIIITPELLSSNVVATPEPSEQEKRIAELEEQNRLLLEQNNKLIDEKQKFENKISDLESKLAAIPNTGDLNCDNIIDILDAIILRRFLAGTIDELPYIPNKGGE